MMNTNYSFILNFKTELNWKWSRIYKKYEINWTEIRVKSIVSHIQHTI